MLMELSKYLRWSRKSRGASKYLRYLLSILGKAQKRASSFLLAFLSNGAANQT